MTTPTYEERVRQIAARILKELDGELAPPVTDQELINRGQRILAAKTILLSAFPSRPTVAWKFDYKKRSMLGKDVFVDYTHVEHDEKEANRLKKMFAGDRWTFPEFRVVELVEKG